MENSQSNGSFCNALARTYFSPMKKSAVFGSIITIMLIGISCAPDPSVNHTSNHSVSNFAADTLYIAHQFQSQLKGWNAGSIDQYMRAYHHHPDLQFITSKGVLRGWETVRDNYLRAFPNQEKMGVLNFKVDRYTMLGDSLIQSTGIWEVARRDTVRSGYFSLIWKQFPEENWKIIVDHTW